MIDRNNCFKISNIILNKKGLFTIDEIQNELKEKDNFLNEKIIKNILNYFYDNNIVEKQRGKYKISIFDYGG